MLKWDKSQVRNNLTILEDIGIKMQIWFYQCQLYNIQIYRLVFKLIFWQNQQKPLINGISLFMLKVNSLNF